MRFIKLALISVVVFFVLLTGIASLLPSHVRISRAVDINTQAVKIYPRAGDIKAWNSWNEFVRLYHNKQWEPNKLAADEITITIEQNTDTLVTAVWQQPSGTRFTSGYRIISYPQDSSRCSVQWYFDLHVRWYPWEKFQSIVYDQQLGPLMEKSLQNLKQQAEHP
jgi:hypothetical protein